MFSSTRIRRMANSCIEDDAEEIRRFFATALCFILFLYMEDSVESSFHVWEKSICTGSAQALFSPDSMPGGSFPFSHFLHLFLSISLCLRTFVIENPGAWLQACGLSPPYFICIMRHSWLNCKCTPWLVLLQYVINVCFFSWVFSYSVCVSCLLRGLQIGWIRLYACFKAQGVLFIGKKYINASAKSLEDLSSTLSASSLPHLNCDTWKYRCVLLGSVTYLLIWCVFSSLHSCHRLTIMPMLWHDQLCCHGIYNSALSIKDERH